MAGSVTRAAARRAADEMVKSIGAPAKRNEDVSGVVRRIDPDGTRWVQLPGDEGLTPCAENAVESMMGDDVTVRIGNHSASIVKNNTKPPDGRTSEKVDEIRAGVGKFDDLYATTATFSVLVAENATVEQIQAAQVYAESVNAQLVAAPVAQFGEICAESATVQDITVEGQVVANIARINSAELKQLNADVATFGVIGAKYARIDAANIDTATMREAWVDSLMVQTGLISHAGTIYELDAIQVNASKIKAGTLDVERLIVTVDGEKYLVHVDAQGTAAYQKLDGNIVEDLTITTDKLVAGAVTAQKITTENIVGTGGWINLRNGTFSYVNTSSQSGISWDGTTLSLTGSGVVISPSVRTPGRMTFHSVPTTPYDPDDRWESHGLTWGGAQNLTWGFAQSLKWGSLYDGGFVMVCQTARATGSFSASDWSVEAAFDSISDAAMRANNFITEVTGGGIMVHPEDDDTSGWRIGGALEMLRSGVSYIWAGLSNAVAYVRVGLEAAGNVVMSGDGYVDVRHGSDVMAHFGYGLGAAQSGTANAPYYTVGTRMNGSGVGNYSFAQGVDNTASNYTSHAEGSETVASGGCSHAEGEFTTASGGGSHAEGFYTTASGINSHAEGALATASGLDSHAEGYDTTASADSSHAEGSNTKASSSFQHVQGRYNVEDSNGTYIHIVGKGSSRSRSNAHTIDWSGNAWFAGSVTQSSDRRLKRHLAYLGDEAADFIRSLRPALFEKDGARHVGLYAQDVQAAEPRSWRTDTVTSQRSSEAYGFDTLSLDYIAIIAPLIAYAQQLDARIEELESR